MRFVLLLVFFVLCSGTGHAIQLPDYRFYSMPETSYYGGIHSIAKDRIGRIWFSGYDALFVYDGNTYTQMNDLVTCHSPMSYWTYGRVVTDSSGALYVATNRGLLRFDYETLRFELVLQGNIGTVTTAEDGTVWVIRDQEIESFGPGELSGLRKHPLPGGATPSALMDTPEGMYAASGNTLYRLDRGHYTPYSHVENPLSEIRDVLVVGTSKYILTALDGLYVCDDKGEITAHFRLESADGKTTRAKGLYYDTAGIVWIATQSGLFLVDHTTGEVRLLRSNLHYPYSLPNNSVWSIYPDPDGGVWIGTYGGKLAYMTFSDNDVNYFKATPGGLNHPIVSCFEEDEKGNLWIGTEGGGLNYWDRGTDRFSYYTQENHSGLNFNLVKNLHYDKEQEILRVSTFNGGLQQLDPNGEHFSDLQVYRPETSEPLSVYDFAREKDAGIWMTNPDAELLYKDLGTGKVTEVAVTDDSGNKVPMKIETLFRGAGNELWLMTYEGLYIVNVNTLGIKKHYYIDQAPYPVNNLCSYYIASDSTVWFGTHGGGVNRLYRDGRYMNYGAAEGLPGKTVFGILEDTETHDIWMSTNSGLYYYEDNTGEIRASAIDNPRLCGAFYVRSCFKTSGGEMLFGGTDGFIMFTPGKMKQNLQKPRVFFTGLLINNEKIVPGDKGSLLKQDISTWTGPTEKDRRIVLTHKQSNIEVRMSSNSYLQADKNRYAYRMLGLSEQWYSLPEGQKSVQFFNLPAGTYQFEVKAANNDGLWGDDISTLSFRITPSPFASGWAYLIYSLLLLGIVYITWRYFTNKKIFAHRLRIEQLKEQNMKMLTQARINFFTHISHDLKTPLTLVIDPLKQLKTLLSGQQAAQANAYVMLIEKNVNRIQNMISQLLQFREIESQKITSNEQPGDIVRFVKDIFSLFGVYAEQRDIETTVSTGITGFYTRFDHDIIEKIFTNLFSNAINYNIRNGYVKVAMRWVSPDELSGMGLSEKAGSAYMAFAVTNSGTEIPDDKKDVIFESYNRLLQEQPAFEKGTGLGLAIVRELVNHLGGKICLDSAHSQVTFTVVLPLERGVEGMSSGSPAYEHTISEIGHIINRQEEPRWPDEQRRKAYSIVVIEDDKGLRDYMRQRLSRYYNVYTAVNGQEGISRAEKIFPQVVITDLMMPEADGFDVCRKLRDNIRTSHIPIVVLSALGGNTENKIRALESGANVFINKPFDMDYLLKQVGSLIADQHRLKERYSRKYIAEPSEVTISSTDEKLLKTAMEHIEKNMSTADYNVESFVADMGIGRTLLYQKMNDILGMSIKEFIMDIRLKRAARLLEKSDVTIAEISYMTGFKNPKYFSTCFKKQYNLTPSEFRNRL